MKRSFLEELAWKLAAVAAAVVLWVVVTREPQVGTVIDAPLEMKNIPQGLDISSEVPDRVHVEVRGPASRLTRENLANSAVVLDLSATQVPGECTFTLGDRDVRLPDGVTFYKAVPSQIALDFERLVTKTVPVRVRFSTGPPDGFELARTVVSPATAVITGPETHVNSIAYVTCDPVDLAAIAGTNAELHANVDVGDPQVRLKSAPNVKLTVVLQRKDMN